MPARFQLVIDCQDPELLARFWAAALGSVNPLAVLFQRVLRVAVIHQAEMRRQLGLDNDRVSRKTLVSCTEIAPSA